ncbi:signal peptidase I [Enterococcus rivorum]|uniref:signal peptidase I n=1 Tax=Enterococcus rivorum TaxID=762845 RepID=UPI000A06810C|nr:signal peptidase I [Enterococcus rivorum]MBP2098155.1 signal peptidase I [Enterococcus rivorum]
MKSTKPKAKDSKKKQIPRKKQKHIKRNVQSSKKRLKAKNYSSKKKSSKQKAKARKRKKRRLLRQLVREMSLSLFIVSVLILVVQQLTFSFPKMIGYSMVPEISHGDRMLVNKIGAVKRFQLIYYQDPESKEKSIRRVIGLPNERLKYHEDQLFINEVEIPERFLEKQVAQAKTSETVFTDNFYLEEVTGTSTVPKQQYFVLGDNRPYATDSRMFGFVKKKDIIGIVEMRVLPLR